MKRFKEMALIAKMVIERQTYNVFREQHEI